MKKTAIALLAAAMMTSTLSAATQGTDNKSIEDEIDKIVGRLYPETKSFDWKCVATGKTPFNGFSSVTYAQCDVVTDLGKRFTASCELHYLAAHSVTNCE